MAIKDRGGMARDLRPSGGVGGSGGAEEGSIAQMAEAVKGPLDLMEERLTAWEVEAEGRLKRFIDEKVFCAALTGLLANRVLEPAEAVRRARLVVEEAKIGRT